MRASTIAARACRKRAQQIDLGKELDKVSRSNGAGFHEILVGVPRKAGAHEDVQHVMHMCFRILNRPLYFGRKGTCQVRVTAMMIVATLEQLVRVRIATRADDVMDAGAIVIPPVPGKRIVGDGGHWSKVRQCAPQSIADADVSGV